MAHSQDDLRHKQFKVFYHDEITQYCKTPHNAILPKFVKKTTKADSMKGF